MIERVSDATRLIDKDVAQLPARDEELEAGYRVNLEYTEESDQPTGYATLRCKAPGCDVLYDVQLRNGAVPKGPRNTMLQHLEKHSSRRRPFRRVR